MLLRAKMVAAVAASFIVPTSAFAGAIVPLDGANTLPRCDSCYVGPVDIGFNINFFGNNYSQLYVSNNGLISFDRGFFYHSSYDSFYVISYLYKTAVISPFFGAVDSRYYGSPVDYGNLIYDSHQAFAVNWVDVNPKYGTTSGGTSASRNSFQVILVERSDVGTGDFDIVFNFDSIQWQNYEAFFGYTANGNSYGYTTHDYPHKYLNAELLDAKQLPYNSLNSDVAGRYVFEVRNGVVTNPLPLSVPEPETWAMLLAGLGLVTGVARRRAKMTG